MNKNIMKKLLFSLILAAAFIVTFGQTALAQAFMPDLTFQNYLVFNSSTQLVNGYQLTFQAFNNGNVSMNNQYSVRYVIRSSANAVKADSSWYPNVAFGIGQTANLNLHLSRTMIAAGDSITLHFDPENRIAEASESNNSRIYTVTTAMIAAGGGPASPAEIVITPKTTTAAVALWNSLQGQVVLKTQGSGEAYYLSPRTHKIYYLKDAAAAFYTLGHAGWGISEDDYNVLVGGSAVGSLMRDRLSGNIMLRAQARGEASYINPSDLSVTYMQNGDVALQVMKSKGMGISNANLSVLID
ncbi:MAG: hypothetical protein Q8O59_02975 [bacterium]|nr:hypothetical protein [bacterium]